MTLASCGFQLRGTEPGAGFDKVFVESRVGIQQLIDQPIDQQLKSDLQALSNEVLSGYESGVPGLVLINEETLERSLSLSANLLNRQIEIEKRIEFQIISGTGEILITDNLRASRELTESQSNPSAKDQERRALMDAINADLSRQLIRLLDTAVQNAYDGNTAATNNYQ